MGFRSERDQSLIRASSRARRSESVSLASNWTATVLGKESDWRADLASVVRTAPQTTEVSPKPAIIETLMRKRFP